MGANVLSRKAQLLQGVNWSYCMSSDVELAKLLCPADYRVSGRTTVFPSDESLRWFIRKHQHLLLQRAALIIPTGRRKLINPAIFDEVVMEVGRENALRLAS